MPQCCGLVRTLRVSIEHWQQWSQLGLGIDHLTFKRGYGWFQRKISCRLIVREKNVARNTWQKKKFLHWKYNVRVMLEIKSCTVVCQEKNSVTRGWEKNSYPNQINHTHPPPPPPLQKSNGRPMTTSHWKTKFTAKIFYKMSLTYHIKWLCNGHM